MNQKALIPTNLKPWMDARRRFRLSHAHIQMARELGMNPKNLGKLANHKQEPWKLPLPEFIAALYAKRFGKAEPDAPACGHTNGWSGCEPLRQRNLRSIPKGSFIVKRSEWRVQLNRP